MSDNKNAEFAQWVFLENLMALMECLGVATGIHFYRASSLVVTFPNPEVWCSSM
jgi:hypothetical protein